jgi:hypothetical protein
LQFFAWNLPELHEKNKSFPKLSKHGLIDAQFNADSEDDIYFTNGSRLRIENPILRAQFFGEDGLLKAFFNSRKKFLKK